MCVKIQHFNFPLKHVTLTKCLVNVSHMLVINPTNVQMPQKKEQIMSFS